MSERMTDERWTEIEVSNDVRPIALFIEAKRARASEMAKDAQILALTSALAEMERSHTAYVNRANAAERTCLELRKDLEARAFREKNLEHDLRSSREHKAIREADWKALEAQTDAERRAAEEFPVRLRATSWRCSGSLRGIGAERYSRTAQYANGLTQTVPDLSAGPGATFPGGFMLPNEKLHESHEYGCGRGLWYDLDCGCWDGPRVTEQDLRERAEGLEAKARHEPLKIGKAWIAPPPR